MRVIAIDGPGGSGKSTVAKAVAEALDLEYLDTGAMYRAAAFAALQRGVDPTDEEAMAKLARRIEIDVDEAGVRVDGVDATIEIRGPEVTRAVSAVAANSAVRDVLRDQQRAWASERGGGVLEGRDIGTVVFPEADVKIFLTAESGVRAQRRAREVTDLEYETVAADLASRDAADEGRADSPLVRADDALHLDTSAMSIDEVVQRVIAELG